MICKQGLTCKFRPDCKFIHLDIQPPAPVINPPQQKPATQQCKWGAKCYTKGCTFSHPPSVIHIINPVPAPQPINPVPAPQPVKTEKTIFEKAQLIHRIKTFAGRQCKFALECRSYKCPFEHGTVTGYSKKAEEVLEKVRQANM